MLKKLKKIKELAEKYLSDDMVKLSFWENEFLIQIADCEWSGKDLATLFDNVIDELENWEEVEEIERKNLEYDEHIYWEIQGAYDRLGKC